MEWEKTASQTIVEEFHSSKESRFFQSKLAQAVSQSVSLFDVKNLSVFHDYGVFKAFERMGLPPTYVPLSQAHAHTHTHTHAYSLLVLLWLVSCV